MLDLDAPLTTVPGIGPRRAASLEALGCRTVEDLLLHLPFRYEDRARFMPLASVREGDRVSFLATVRAPRLIRTRRRGFSIFQATLDDGTAALPVLWYNQPYLGRVLAEGRSAYLYGELRMARTGKPALRFENPQFELVDAGDPDPIHAGRIVPVYEKLGSLSGKMLRRLIHNVLEGGGGGGEGADFLPAELRARLGFPPREEALREVHFPSRGAQGLDALNAFATPHHRRLIFEELFLLQLGLAIRRASDRKEERGFVYATGDAIRAKLKGLLPFRLTGGQREVLRELVADLTSPHPMNRLLQGEVGSGKTILAVLAMALAAENGLQSALMAPTELLAEQHERALRARLEPAGYRVVLLTSAVKGKERRERLEALRDGSAHVAVGTHALQEKEVAFHRLGLVVVDEQHRFGVMQRSRLRDKGTVPDTLVMTATPIPRTLALALYGDLDVSLLEELPPGRSPVATTVRDEAGREELYGWMRGELARGRQAFVIYPLVEEREGSGLRAAAAMAKRLAEETFPDHAVGLVHGRMKAEEKAAAMEAFRAGRLAVLVATTVVEVGIDVPGATILVVEHAERFGLSQLHQLRGRVGRGAEAGTCVLMAGENLTEAARARLGAIERERSGFRLAEIDLELRGPGELFGTRQAGLPDLRVASLVRDRELLEEARREAFALVGEAGAGFSAARRGRARAERRGMKALRATRVRRCGCTRSSPASAPRGASGSASLPSGEERQPHPGTRLPVLHGKPRKGNDQRASPPPSPSVAVGAGSRGGGGGSGIGVPSFSIDFSSMFRTSLPVSISLKTTLTDLGLGDSTIGRPPCISCSQRFEATVASANRLGILSMHFSRCLLGIAFLTSSAPSPARPRAARGIGAIRTSQPSLRPTSTSGTFRSISTW